ncbi:C1 family peptidase [Pedobacter montanisoli]|uniref:Peptidase C1A papain C-terminal domain-containing protein n=1 Tax=Pedobacter montanisoli TaxID=2923277 RepID=A0ABS9ZWM2_9SPHI|nr:hypothetical protein [Pedobacter montanisoli]MCJ0742715.1 hypothetical protein [Pedobacter montanisoli]
MKTVNLQLPSEQLPSKIDLSVYCPNAKGQYRSTCYAYAFAYTALSINYCVKHNITERKEVEENAFSPGFIASRHRQNTNFNYWCGRQGNYDIDLDIFGKDGCPKLIDFPPDCTATIPDNIFALASQTRLDKYEYIQTQNDTSVQAIEKIKIVLAHQVPVLIVVNLTKDFSNKLKNDCNTTLPSLYHGKKASGYHDICVIGYDDDPNSKYFGRFLIKNNYKTWGDSRNMAWVLYNDMMYMISQALYFTIL